MPGKLCIGGIIAIIIVLVLAGLYLSIEKPDVQVTNIRYHSISVSEPSISFYVTLNVDNGNSMGATLKKVEANVYVNGDYVGDSYSEEEFEIKAKGVTEVTVVLKIKNIPLSILGSSTADIKVVGTAYLRVVFWTVAVDFEESKVVQLG